MAKNKQTYTLQIDAELGNLESKLSSVKSLLSGVLSSAKAPKGLDKSLEKIEGLIDKVRAKASQPIDSKAGFSSIAKDVGGAQIALAELLKVLQSINSLPEADRLSFLPPDAQAQINKIVQSLANYASAIDAATTETAELVAAREKLANAEKKVIDAQAKVGTKQSGLDAAKAEKKAAEDAIAVIENRKKKLAELYEEQKKIEEFYNGADESGNKRNKSKKYDGTSMRPQDIAKKISKAELASAGDAESLEAQKAALKAAKADIASYTTQLTTANRTLREVSTEQEALAKTVETLSQAFENAKPEQLENAYAQLRKEAEGLGVSLDGIGEGYSEKDSAELIKRITDLKTKGFDQLTKATDKAEKNVREFGEGCKNIKGDLETGTEALEEMNQAAAQQEAFENKIKQFLGLSGAAQVLRSALRDAMQTITELDATMTEMAVVTDLTVGDYWDQLPEYSKQASDLGVSINSAYKAATLYYQQGLKGNEVTKISAETLKMAKIAGLDAADATDKMTAALRGFNMELNEASAQKVADVYSELAAITAADVDEISNAMTKTASIAHSAGMEFETTAAFLSQIIETTRESAETAGTAMKTVIARFQELKKDPAEIGEVEGEIVDANKIETALRSVGVALRDSSGQFRELDDVFLELSSKWDSLDKNTQRYIATIAAGSRQQSRFIAMMSDYGRTQELVTAANNSAGASQKQFEKTLEGVEAKLEKLKNAWHEFTMGIMNSDLVKTGIDILTKFLEVLNKMTDGIGDKGFGGGIMKLMTVFGVFKLGMTIFKKFETPLGNFFSKIVEMAGLKGFEAGEKFSEKAQEGSQAAMQKSQPSQQKSSEQKEKKGFKGWLADKTGWSDYKEASAKQKYYRDLMEDKNGDREKNQKELEKFKSEVTFGKNGQVYKKGHRGALSKEEADNAKKQYDQLIKKEEEYANAEAKFTEASKQKWDGVADRIGAVGQAVTTVGIGVSALGGIFSQLGLEQFGSVLSDIGTIITFVGTALMAIPPIITLINFILSTPPLGIIMIILAAILVLVTAIISCINNNSPEKKLEKAAKSAEAAADAAEKTRESFEELGNALDELGEKQKSLEELTRGTDEWNKAVQETNASILDLINKYPELAGLVEGEGGVLTLDVNSEEVQKVLNKYEQSAVAAKGAELGAKAKVSEAKQQQAFGNLDAVKAVGKQRGRQEAFLATGIGSMAGLGGAVIGATIGAITGTIEASKTKTDKELQRAIGSLAESIEEGATNTDVGSIYGFLLNEGVAKDEAELLAQSFAEDTAALLEYGEALRATNNEQKAYYQAMAMNAQSLIDLGAHTQEQIDQMSTVVDDDLLKVYEENQKKELDNLSRKEWKKRREEFVKQQYGENARVKGKKIVDANGDVITEFVDNESLKEQIAAAEATTDAAEAMEAVPNIIKTNLKTLPKIVSEKTAAEAQKAFEKAFSGQSLTQGDLGQFGNILGKTTYNYLDQKGVAHQGSLDEAWAALGSEGQQWWSSKEHFERESDKDYSGIRTLWDEMSVSEKQKVYGGTDEAAYERYEATFTDIIEENNRAFEKALNSAKGLGLEGTMSKKLDSKAAQQWYQGLEKTALAGGNVKELDTALNTLLGQMTDEDATAAMAQINAVDKMSIDSWENLAEVFDELDLEYSTQSLDEFIEKGKEVSGAIKQIDFSSLGEQLNNTRQLLDKIKQSGRTYSEDDYKALIAANKSLEKKFTKVGDDFLYTGGSMEELTEAIEKNTEALLQEANKQLKDKIAMADIVDKNDNTFGSVDYMDNATLYKYLSTMRDAFVAGGRDMANLGIEGLSNNTSFFGQSTEQLLEWAKGLAQLVANQKIYKEEYTEGVRRANVQAYIGNEASYNARMAVQGGEFADEHQDALIAQAVKSGVVTNAVIESYQAAIEANDKAEIETIGNQIANAVEKAIEKNEGRSQYIELVDRVVDAIEDAREKEIDALRDVNDSIKSANDSLINKLQQQIDADRQARDNAKTEQSISDLYNQRALLYATGGSASEIAAINQQIAEATESYQDERVDQAIQGLQDANEQAAEQRERQIALLEAQLQNDRENGEITKRAEQIVSSGLDALDEGQDLMMTELGKLLWGKEGENLSKLAEQDWVQELMGAMTQASNWLANQGYPKVNVTNNAGDGDHPGNPNKGDTNNSGAARDQALEAGWRAIGGSKTGLKGIHSNGEYDAARESYRAAGGDVNKFDTTLQRRFSGLSGLYGQVGGLEVLAKDKNGTPQSGNVWLNGGMIGQAKINYDGNLMATGEAKDMLDYYYKGIDGNNYLGMYNGIVYMRYNNGWYRVETDQKVKDDMRKYLTSFKTGGLADFTGPAWLDGSPSRPEYILNSKQTERFFSLIDVLENFNTKESGQKSAGDNYFDIAINVEKIDNDYDVEQVANKIRRMIYEDATYRNVNAISHIR